MRAINVAVTRTVTHDLRNTSVIDLPVNIKMAIENHLAWLTKYSFASDDSPQQEEF